MSRLLRAEGHASGGRWSKQLSVAFTKEDSAETASETMLPDRPIPPGPNLVTAAGLKALERQLAEARAEIGRASCRERVSSVV